MVPEPAVFAALKRELTEEVGITIHSSSQLMMIEHDDGDKCVKLGIHVVSDFSGEAHGAEGQPSEWVNISELTHYDFPAANAEIIEKLQSRYA